MESSASAQLALTAVRNADVGGLRAALASNAREVIEARDEHKGTALHLAAEYGDRECMQVLIDAGADLNARDKWGWTPLHWAAHDENAASVRFLLHAGADAIAASTHRFVLFARDSREVSVGSTPLAIAESPQVRKLLARAEIFELLAAPMVAAKDGALFDPRLFDARLWRVVARFIE